MEASLTLIIGSEVSSLEWSPFGWILGFCAFFPRVCYVDFERVEPLPLLCALIRRIAFSDKLTVVPTGCHGSKYVSFRILPSRFG